jgi:WD40 repeat protein
MNQGFKFQVCFWVLFVGVSQWTHSGSVLAKSKSGGNVSEMNEDHSNSILEGVEESTFESLPDEVKVEVLSRLEGEDLTRVSQVSREFQGIVQDSRFGFQDEIEKAKFKRKMDYKEVDVQLGQKKIANSKGATFSEDGRFALLLPVSKSKSKSKSKLTHPSGDTPEVWDVVAGKLLYQVQNFRQDVTAMKISPDGKRFALATYDFVQVYDLETGELEKSTWATRFGEIRDRYIDRSDRRVGCEHLEFSPTGDQIAVGKGEFVVVLDLISGKEMTFKHLSAFVSSIGFSPSGTHLVVGYLDGIAEVFDLKKQKLISTFTAVQGVVGIDFQIRFITEDQLLSVKYDQISVWNRENDNQITQDPKWKIPRCGYRRVEFS